MNKLVQKQNQSQEARTINTARFWKATPKSGVNTHSILRLHRGISDQLDLIRLQSQEKNFDQSLPGTMGLPFGYDFSQIPVHGSAPAMLQTKPALNTPEDQYEQEKEHVARQVMHTPGPQLQRTCACGGLCLGCKNEPDTHRNLQAKRTQANDSVETVAPSIVHKVLHSDGQPLDLTTQRFMESRFKHDFSQVRVHTNTQADESARAVNALAYTVGQNVVFRLGRYDPTSMYGRRLLAHELTHVVQQGTGGIPDRLVIGHHADMYEQQAEQTSRKEMGTQSVHHSPSDVKLQRLPAEAELMGNEDIENELIDEEDDLEDNVIDEEDDLEDDLVMTANAMESTSQILPCTTPKLCSVCRKPTGGVPWAANCIGNYVCTDSRMHHTCSPNLNRTCITLDPGCKKRPGGQGKKKSSKSAIEVNPKKRHKKTTRKRKLGRALSKLGRRLRQIF